MLNIPTSNTAIITLDYDEVHALSVDLLKLLQANDTRVSAGIAALALSLGRLLAPQTLEVETEVKFMQDVLDWGGMYFADGGDN